MEANNVGPFCKYGKLRVYSCSFLPDPVVNNDLLIYIYVVFSRNLAGQLVDKSRPGDLNQALMELGATICMPTNPKCTNCPVSDQCRALSLSRCNKSSIKVTDFPPKVIKSKQRLEFAAVCVVIVQNELCENQKHVSGNLYLLVKRPDKGLLAGLWEFPSVLVAQKQTDVKSRRTEMDNYLKNLNFDLGKDYDLVIREEVGKYLHIFSHIRLQMYVELMILTTKGYKSNSIVGI